MFDKLFNSKISKIYFIIEMVLLLALISMQFVLIFQGKYVGDKSSNIWIYIGIAKVSLTAISLIFVIINFISNYKDGLSILDLFVIYFVLITIADVFFSFSSILIVPHICFLVAYLLFVFIRKGKWFEVFIPIGAGALIFIFVWLVLKMDPLTAIVDSILGFALLFNVVRCWYMYIKTKDRFYLFFSLATTFILVSDLSIALGSFVKNPMALNNTINMINWPFYVSGNILFVCNYMIYRKEKAH